MGLAEMFWRRDRQQAVFDVQIFNTFVRSHCNTLLSQSYRKQEMKKKRVYEERIRKVEHGTFSSLLFTTAGGLGPAATVVYKRLASGIAEKHDRPMGNAAPHQMQTELLLLRSTIVCLRGSQSTTHSPANSLAGDIINLTTAEGRVPNDDRTIY